MGFYKEPTDCFIEITNHFVGLEAYFFLAVQVYAICT